MHPKESLTDEKNLQQWRHIALKFDVGTSKRFFSLMIADEIYQKKLMNENTEVL